MTLPKEIMMKLQYRIYILVILMQYIFGTYAIYLCYKFIYKHLHITHINFQII